MNITTASLRGRIALMASHCAGMVDLIALPVWVGTLISVYRLDPQQASPPKITLRNEAAHC